MARPLRLDFPGALYHITGRGNPARGLFATRGARDLFLERFAVACQRGQWRVHGLVLLRDEYHFALETPEANLSKLMQWVQVTFSNHVVHHGTGQGPVFVDRYKAQVVEDLSVLGNVAHFLHLAPLRAKQCRPGQLGAYAASSLHWILEPRTRPDYFCATSALAAAGGLADTAAGRRLYLQFLQGLAGDIPAQEERGFHKMSRGWGIGSTAFRKKLATRNDKFVGARGANLSGEDRPARAKVLRARLKELMKAAGKSAQDAARDRKSAAWKVAIAGQIYDSSAVSNAWLSRQLHMGASGSLGRLLARRG